MSTATSRPPRTPPSAVPSEHGFAIGLIERRLLARGYGFQFLQGLSDDGRQVSLLELLVPAFNRDPEDGDPCLGGQTRGRVCDAALAQRVGDRRGERCELDQLAFVQLWVRCNDALALPGEFVALLKHGAGGLEGRRDRVHWRSGIRRAGNSAYEQLLQRAGASE